MSVGATDLPLEPANTRANLIWATGYNVLAVPLAARVLAFAGLCCPRQPVLC